MFWLPSIKLRTICFYSKKLKMILKFQPFEYYRKKDKFASFQNLQSKDLRLGGSCVQRRSRNFENRCNIVHDCCCCYCCIYVTPS